MLRVSHMQKDAAAWLARSSCERAALVLQRSAARLWSNACRRWRPKRIYPPTPPPRPPTPPPPTPTCARGRADAHVRTRTPAHTHLGERTRKRKRKTARRCKFDFAKNPFWCLRNKRPSEEDHIDPQRAPPNPQIQCWGWCHTRRSAEMGVFFARRQRPHYVPLSALNLRVGGAISAEAVLGWAFISQTPDPVLFAHGG